MVSEEKAGSIAGASPARLYCTLVGGAVAIAGLLGFFYSSGFETGVGGVRSDTDELLGIFAVNGWHNLLHLGLGVVGLAAASSAYAARTYALAVGLAYVLLAIWGLVFDDNGVILGLLPIDDQDNVLHLLLGLTGLGAGAATPPVIRPQRPRRESRRRPRPRRASRAAAANADRSEARGTSASEGAASEARAAGARRSRATRRGGGDAEAPRREAR